MCLVAFSQSVSDPKSLCPSNLLGELKLSGNLISNVGIDLVIWRLRLCPSIYQNVSELATRLIKSQGITFAPRSSQTLRRLTSKPKSRWKGAKKTIVYKVKCMDCSKCYINQTGRKVTTRIHERKLIARGYALHALPHVHPRRPKGTQIQFG